MPQSKTPSVFSPEIIERFWSRVVLGGPDECWPWQGAAGNHGYGLGPQGTLAHRLSWELAYGPIPDKMRVCHTCDNRLCCNPAHYFLGTDADNAMDKARKGRIPIAKLNPEIVRDMRSRYAEGDVSTRQLASEYGVDRRAIVFALKGQTWTHVKGGEFASLPEVRAGKSGYRGVSVRRDGKWRSRIHINNREINLGAFATAEEAARAYDAAARELLGECAWQNFPKEAAA